MDMDLRASQLLFASGRLGVKSGSNGITLGYFIAGLFCYICSFFYLCGYFFLLMPYWLVYVSHVEDKFFNTPRL
jgi:hypothetical protein